MTTYDRPACRVDPYWASEQECSFAQALCAGSSVLQQCTAAIPSLPPKDLSKPYPASLSEALALYHAREEEKRKKGLGKTTKSKQKSAIDREHGYPGAKEGGGDQSAFWMYVEDYFRDVTQDDVQTLLAPHLEPLRDPVFKVPSCGRSLEEEQQRQQRKGSSGHHADSDAVDSKPYADPNSPSGASERRSSRLVSRNMKEEESKRLADLQAEEEAKAEAEAAAAAAAAAAEAAAMATVPLTAAGVPATRLLEVASLQQLLMLTQQIAVLQTFSEINAGPAFDQQISSNLMLLQLSCRNGTQPHPAVRTKLHEFLAAKAKALLEALGAQQEVPDPLALRRAGVTEGQRPQHDGLAPDAQEGEGLPHHLLDAAVPNSTAADENRTADPPSAAEPGQRATKGASTLADAATAKPAASDSGATATGATTPCAEVLDGQGTGSSAGPSELSSQLAASSAVLPSASYTHPYTKLMLAQRVPQHVIKAAVEVTEPPVASYSKAGVTSGQYQGGLGRSGSAYDELETQPQQHPPTAIAHAADPSRNPTPAPIHPTLQQQAQAVQALLLSGFAAAPSHAPGDAAATPQHRPPAWFALPHQLAAVGARATPPPVGTPPLPPHLLAQAAAQAAGLAKAFPGLVPLPGTTPNGTPLLFQPRAPMPGAPGALTAPVPISAPLPSPAAMAALAAAAAARPQALRLSPSPGPSLGTVGVVPSGILPRGPSPSLPPPPPPPPPFAAAVDATAITPQHAQQPAGDAQQDGLQGQQQHGLTADGDQGSRPGSATGSRPGARSRSTVNYSVLAGRKHITRTHTGPPKKRPPTGPAALAFREGPDLSAQHPVALAVAAMVSAGPPDGSAADQWTAQLAPQAQLIAAAPEDEILAELLATQNELMQQMAINRGRLLPVAQNLLTDIEKQGESAAVRLKEEDEVKAWIDHLRERRRQAEREKRDLKDREKMAEKSAAVMASPRPRQRLQAAPDGIVDIEAPHLKPEEMYDFLARRLPDEEAFCAVCGEGHSEAPNEILFCERCDVAVHQACYDIPQVPSGEWLCWPCRKYEEEQRAQGVPQQQIRPHRWEQQPEGEENKSLSGGSCDVTCALCPIKCGAFRQTVDGRQWVHQVDALWQPETSVVASSNCAVVAGVENLRPDRLGVPCAICHLTHGAVIKCCQSGCPHMFHPLCGRNCGLYLVIRGPPGKQQYRIYCALHSPAQRAKDAEAQDKAKAALAASQTQAAAREVAKLQEKRRLALAELDAREMERDQLKYERVCWEKLRVLCDQVKKREKTKAQLTRMLPELQKERREQPASAIPLLQQALAARPQLPPPAFSAPAAGAAPVAAVLQQLAARVVPSLAATPVVPAGMSPVAPLLPGTASTTPLSVSAAAAGVFGAPSAQVAMGGLPLVHPHQFAGTPSLGAVDLIPQPTPAQVISLSASKQQPAAARPASASSPAEVALSAMPLTAGRAKRAASQRPSSASAAPLTMSKRRRTPSVKQQEAQQEVAALAGEDEGVLGEDDLPTEDEEVQLGSDEEESEELEDDLTDDEDDLRPAKRARGPVSAGAAAAAGAAAGRFRGTARQQAAAASREAAAAAAGAATALRLQRELEMTRSQAAAANQQLRQRVPTGKLQYVPVERLRQQAGGATAATQQTQQDGSPAAAPSAAGDQGRTAGTSSPRAAQGPSPAPRRTGIARQQAAAQQRAAAVKAREVKPTTKRKAK